MEKFSNQLSLDLETSQMKFLLILFVSAHRLGGFPVYDCSLNPRNIKNVDMTEIGDCENPEEQYEDPREVNIQVIKNDALLPQEVWQCQLFRTITAVRCGFDSITYTWFEIETSAPVEISSEDCRRIIKSKKISMYEKEWKISSLNHFSFEADIIGE